MFKELDRLDTRKVCVEFFHSSSFPLSSSSRSRVLTLSPGPPTTILFLGRLPSSSSYTIAIFVQFKKSIRSLNARPSCPRDGNMSVTKCRLARSVVPRSAMVNSSGILTDSQMDSMWLAR